MAAHSWFAASASSRWLQCGASAVIDASHLPPEHKPAADRGTMLHAISEEILREGHDDLPSGLSPPDGEAVMQYVDFIRGREGVKFYEITSTFVPHCGGTSDTVVVQPDGETLEIIDAKFGSWYVDPFENTQLLIYALGVVRELGAVLYDFKRVRVTIAQPACDNYRSWPIDIDELERWGKMISDRVAAIMDGDAEFNPGVETCKWCPGKTICPAYAEFGRASAKQQFDDDYFESADDPEHHDEEVTAVMAILDMDPLDWTWAMKMQVAELASAWAKTIENAVKQMVLDDQDSVPGFKAVEGNRSQFWSDKKGAKKYLEQEGFDESEMYTDPEPEFLSPSKAKSLYKGKGSGAKKKELDEFIGRAPGSPTVVPESDSRPALSKKAVAKKEFDDDPTE